MDLTCFLLFLVIVLPILYIIYGAFNKFRNLIFTPLTKSKVFSDLENKDGFGKVRKDSEEHKFLNRVLTEILVPFNLQNPMKLKRAVFQKDDYDYYIADVEFPWTPGANQAGDPMMPNRYFCLFINSPLDIANPLKISRDYSSSSLYSQRDTFEDKYTITPYDEIVAERLLFREVREVFEAEDGRYPLTDRDTNEASHPIGRSVILFDKGIILVGNPDGNRYNMAEMMNLGKKLLSLEKAITESDDMI